MIGMVVSTGPHNLIDPRISGKLVAVGADVVSQDGKTRTTTTTATGSTVEATTAIGVVEKQ
jgi:hypothetical protein